MEIVIRLEHSGFEQLTLVFNGGLVIIYSSVDVCFRCGTVRNKRS